MRFQAKSEEEILAERVMPEGIYDFEVTSAQEKTSTKGNEMIVAELKVFGADGGFRLVTDYLMEKMAFKLRHFCEATGLLDKYETGSLTALDCEGRSGRVMLQVEPERKGKDKDGNDKTFPPKNSVKDYIGATAGGYRKPAVPSGGGDMEDSDIPFSLPTELMIGAWS